MLPEQVMDETTKLTGVFETCHFFRYLWADSMAKIFTIWLVLIYAFSATGATVHLHYCCGKLQELAVQDQKSPSRDDCPMCLKHHENNTHTDHHSGESCNIDQQSPGHCQDVKVDAKKITEEHLRSTDKNPVKIFPLESLVFTLVSFIDFPLDGRHTIQTTDDPLLVGAIPLFIQHCTYRI